MWLKNYVEEIAVEVLDKIIAEGADICQCKSCRDDIIAWVLNRTDAHYFTTDTGRTFFTAEGIKKEFLDDIVKKIYQAATVINAKPRHKLQEKLTVPEDIMFKKLLDKLYKDRNVDFRDYRNRCIKRRIATRMRSVGVESYAEYMKVLDTVKTEYEKLIDSLTINVTEFFRNPEVFTVFERSVLPDIIETKTGRKTKVVRIWSAGCASGEEPYTIAIILNEYLKRQKQDIICNIFATDIDDKVLERAKKAVYAPGSLHEVSRAILEKYFIPEGENFRLINEIRDMVRFKKHDLIMDKPLERLDLVFCRNVMIYFEKNLQEKIFSNFYHALNPGGYYVMAKVETLSVTFSDLFEIVDRRERIYRKKPTVND